MQTTSSTGVRRAFVFASAERYAVVAIGFAIVPVLARLLDPAEFGISVLGMAALAMAEAIRDFGGSAYIIQEKELTQERVRSAFTIMLVLTLAMTSFLFIAAEPIARFYKNENLAPFLRITALCYLAGPFVSPVNSLLRRDMAFGRIATISVTTTIVNSGLTVLFAILGFSFMSFAWANLVSGTLGMMLGFYFRPDFTIFRPSLREWKAIIRFGRYDIGFQLLTTLWEYLPYLIFGRFLNAAAVGIYQRATSLCLLPRRVLLGGFANIALAAISAQVRNGARPKAVYLNASSLVSAVQWPSLIVIVLLANPIIALLLGPKWSEVTPLVRIIGVALMFNFAPSLTYPTLVSMGLPRVCLSINLIVIPISIMIVATAAQWGIVAVAWSMMLTVPLEMMISLFFLRHQLSFTWKELGVALLPSVIVAEFTATGPLLLIAFLGTSELTLFEGALGLTLAGAGWFFGLWIVRHPLWQECAALWEQAILWGKKVKQRHNPIFRYWHKLRGTIETECA